MPQFLDASTIWSVTYWKEKSEQTPETSSVPKLTTQQLVEQGWYYVNGASLPIPTENLFGYLTDPVNKIMMSIGKVGGWSEYKIFVGYKNGFDRLGYWAKPLGWTPQTQNGGGIFIPPADPNPNNDPNLELPKETYDTSPTGYSPFLIGQPVDLSELDPKIVLGLGLAALVVFSS